MFRLALALSISCNKMLRTERRRFSIIVNREKHNMLILIIGGARSGKSRFAQELCKAYEKVVYLATCENIDEEMAERIAQHKRNRPDNWQTIEEPINVADVVARDELAESLILIDCITVWIGNLCHYHRDLPAKEIQATALREVERLVAACRGKRVVAVTNEVGSGIVPENALARLFRDIHGLANQTLARAAEQVYITVAGIPIEIKST